MVGTVSVTSKHALGLNCAEFHFYKGKWLLGSATQPFTQTTNGAQRGEWRKMETLWQVRNPTASFGGRFCEWIQHWFGTGLILEKSWRTQPGLLSLNLMLEHPGLSLVSPGAGRGPEVPVLGGRMPAPELMLSLSPSPTLQPRGLSMGFGAIKWQLAARRAALRRPWLLRGLQ